jgi:(1->4)-alpha-D-glucan 1-alpha-D-glucosylmutase
VLRATYRLQFRAGVGYREAARIVPHLAAAGVSHLYASPIFTATSGSTHGYDVADHTTLDPTLGGEEGFAVLAEALRRDGIGLLLDIVPNHMAASSQNPWWRDVLKHGAESRFARHFDIDWSARRLILPILGKPYGEALGAGDIGRGEHPEWGPVLRVPGEDLPLRPGTEDIRDIHALHEAQHYRVAHWRLGRDRLTYRRFFEITGLVGVRVEDETVFEDVHALPARLIADGIVDALRVDHVDGLADPAGYLARLARYGVPVLVEKILEPGEPLRDWPVAGTTGYEFIAALAALFVDGDGLAQLSRAYGTIANDDAVSLAKAAKTEILTKNLAGELDRLARLALSVLSDDPATRDHGPTTVREGLVALLSGLSVYRTYIEGRATPEDRAVLDEARAAAGDANLDDEQVLADLVGLLLREDDDPVRREFVRRFQQTSGPLMAKAVEDTLFYRHHRLLALNEVGGTADPELGAAPYLRVAEIPGLAATQTHDTKRGEDARARLYALSDPVAATLWEDVWPTLPGDVPERLRWALGQMLFASAPLGEDPAFADRFREAALKTVREAKEETSWTRGDAAFEARVAEAAEAMAGAIDRLAPLAGVWRAGAVVGLAQALLKTTAKPAPDLYQGTFDWDFSMVDPDNRRPVDFAAEAARVAAAREAPLDRLLADWTDGRIKARVLVEGLRLRAERPALFAAESRLTELPSSPGIAAFLREGGGEALLVAVPTRPYGALRPAGLALDLPAEVMLPCAVRSRFTGAALDAGRTSLADEFAAIPVLLAGTF